MSEQSALDNTAAKLGIPTDWLSKLINFESAGSWDPKIKNPISGAMGLIQFLPSTARSMGYVDAQDLVDKYPTIETQVQGPVYDYLRALAPFPTEQSLYMAVFNPASRNVPIDTVFSATIQANNPGIVTVADYINKVNSKLNTFLLHTTPVKIGGILLVLAGLGYLIYTQYKKEAVSWEEVNPKNSTEQQIIVEE